MCISKPATITLPAFGISNPSIAERVEVLPAPFGPSRPKISPFSISNDIIYRILEDECGKYSENKKIPAWVFELPVENLKHLYKTLMLGDGHATGERYTTKSVYLKDDFPSY